MRQSCTTVLVLSIASMTIGCQQAPNAMSPLTPVGAMAPAPQLAPVSATSTGIGPFGARTRIAPPATGSYSVPNNYMGGTAPIGQVGVNNQRLDSFRSTSGVRAAAFADSAPTAGVAATSFGSGFGTQPGPSHHPQQSPMQPQLGGMHVNDLTGAPPPPGYHGQGAMMIPSQPLPNQAPSGFVPSANPNIYQNQPVNTPPRIQIPSRIPGADIAAGNQQVLSIARRPGSTVSSAEIPLQPSPLQPSFKGSSQFQTPTPSTEPVNERLENQSPDLPWRRPSAAY